MLLLLRGERSLFSKFWMMIGSWLINTNRQFYRRPLMPIFGQVDPPSSDNTAGEFADGIKQQVETAGWPCGDYNDDDDYDDDDNGCNIKI